MRKHSEKSKPANVPFQGYSDALSGLTCICEEEGSVSYTEIRGDFCLLSLELNRIGGIAPTARPIPTVFYDERIDPFELNIFAEDMRLIKHHRGLLLGQTRPHSFEEMVSPSGLQPLNGRLASRLALRILRRE